MEQARGVDMDPAHQTIIIALLLHPRLANLRLQFRDELDRVLAKPDAVAKIANTSGITADELATKGRELTSLLASGTRVDDQKLAQYANVALAFCLSASFLNFWGHFTATLGKLIRDDALIRDVAGSLEGCPAEQVRVAIRQFSDSKRMPTGRAGL